MGLPSVKYVSDEDACDEDDSDKNISFPSFNNIQGFQ